MAVCTQALKNRSAKSSNDLHSGSRAGIFSRGNNLALRCFRCALADKSTKLQAPSSREHPSANNQTRLEQPGWRMAGKQFHIGSGACVCADWSLKFGVSLELGGWCLVLP